MASPVVTELEVVMLDWLGKLLDLPPVFLACSEGKGGGIIQVLYTQTLIFKILIFFYILLKLYRALLVNLFY